MRNPIKYISDKVNAWRYKSGMELCRDHPVLFELKWTAEHFGDLYRQARDHGLVEALKYDLAVTECRNELRKDESRTLRSDRF
jgi:hypothetical protein